MSDFELDLKNKNSVEAQWGLRKIVVQAEETVTEYGVPVTGLTKVSAVAVIKNPFIGNEVDSDLLSRTQEIAPILAKVLSDRILAKVGRAENIVAFGKGAIIGTAGELEHGAALIHTPYYANLLRAYFEGETVIPFSDVRDNAGSDLIIPLGTKVQGPTRDFFQHQNVYVSDAPMPDEIVVAAAVSTSTRPFPRSGDRTIDPQVSIEEMEKALR